MPISRPRAETMPAVTVPPRPNGLPMAITQSPVLTSERPSGTKGNGLLARGFEQRKIGFGIGADDPRLQDVASLGNDLDLDRAFHHVMVGDDVAVRRNEEAGPLAPDGRKLPRALPEVTALRTLEEPFQGRALERIVFSRCAAGVLFIVIACGYRGGIRLDADRHHGRRDALDEGREAWQHRLELVGCGVIQARSGGRSAGRGENSGGSIQETAQTCRIQAWPQLYFIGFQHDPFHPYKR